MMALLNRKNGSRKNRLVETYLSVLLGEEGLCVLHALVDLAQPDMDGGKDKDRQRAQGSHKQRGQDRGSVVLTAQ